METEAEISVRLKDLEEQGKEVVRRVNTLEQSIEKRLGRIEKAAENRGEEGHKRDILLETIKVKMDNQDGLFKEIRKSLDVQAQRMFTLMISIVGATLTILAGIGITLFTR